TALCLVLVLPALATCGKRLHVAVFYADRKRQFSTHTTESPLFIGSPHDVLPAEPYTAMLRSSANVRTNASATSGDLRSTVRFFVTSFGSTSILPELV